MRPLAAATLAALFVGVAAPAASASHVDADCGFDSLAQDDVTGPDVYEGVAYGYATADGDTLAVRCAIYVNYQEVTSTPYGPTRRSAAVTAGRVTFTAGDADIVTICPVVTTTAHGERQACPDMSPEQIPPEWVYEPVDDAIDAVDPVFAVVDAQVCPVLGAQAPGTPPVAIDPTGDVYVDGWLVWDCPPFEA